ncbi:MAG: cobalt-precorrin-5B (C(1))-methyltransferase CbiD [Anaeromicrobium sp.]|jgi:cobalt-precorrin-5B (C1)-methyltransferase|uniref:cobalt-precorrin-5B (C(1))-methyltransferase CbiD n=1 Tax=Anaeromicrobium sp. TaxID=1929132 RepID=UPI0025E00888|nr:cobalt-precorrin-5B (C(1))-methyltransferase CbiD [Anaeromicrobium sp.]MCT4593025.1 cobalt-precorrin-5B (C(1))-methyltransferase CbiD [Anaeromicrobium sp.]
MLDKYIVKNGKKMRYGYTTGSCAAAAAKACAIMIKTGEIIDHVTIDTPKGWTLTLKVLDPSIHNGEATCAIKKDGGDDPDKTNNMLIYGNVKLNHRDEINITGGVGVGLVTKDGLQISKGEHAINPVPRKMIRKEVREVIGEKTGAYVKIYAPEGVEIGKKTFNPRLGIMGGISILGTSGIVEPMSEEAFRESLNIELKVAVKDNKDYIVLVPGNYGEDLALNHYKIPKEKIVKTSNFIGYMLEKCVEQEVKKVLLIGHIGKMVKLAGGIFYTHSKMADSRVEILASNLAYLGAPTNMIKEIFHCVTTEAALDIIEKSPYKEVYDLLIEKCEKRANMRIYDELEVGVITFSMTKGILAVGQRAKKMLEEI